MNTSVLFLELADGQNVQLFSKLSTYFLTELVIFLSHFLKQMLEIWIYFFVYKNVFAHSITFISKIDCVTDTLYLV